MDTHRGKILVEPKEDRNTREKVKKLEKQVEDLSRLGAEMSERMVEIVSSMDGMKFALELLTKEIAELKSPLLTNPYAGGYEPIPASPEEVRTITTTAGDVHLIGVEEMSTEYLGKLKERIDTALDVSRRNTIGPDLTKITVSYKEEEDA